MITPEQMGHDVKISSDDECCLGCGRTTKAKHSPSGKRVFWRRERCKPVIRMRRYTQKNHAYIFEDWWTCKNCKAKGPQLNKRKCTNHIAGKRGPGPDDDDDNKDHKIMKTENTEEYKRDHTVGYDIEIHKQYITKTI
eukprot:11200479-Heterocapsa_arctica.AAC.1